MSLSFFFVVEKRCFEVFKEITSFGGNQNRINRTKKNYQISTEECMEVAQNELYEHQRFVKHKGKRFSNRDFWQLK